MNNKEDLRFILHVSDFHLNGTYSNTVFAQNALSALTEKLSFEKIKVDYLIHTGDIIDSSDLYSKTAKILKLDPNLYFKKSKEKSKHDEFNVNAFAENADIELKTKFNKKLLELTNQRFKSAEKVLKTFFSQLNIPLGNVVICSGNHDIVRLIPINTNSVTCEKSSDETWQYKSNLDLEKGFEPFENFLDNLEVANSKKRCHSDKSVSYYCIDNLNFLIINTNWENPIDQKQGYYCARCDTINNTVNNIEPSHNKINIVLAHKPLYEICERTRLSYQRYIQTPFMSNLRKFVEGNGIYLCGDKHTRSIVGTQIHDIPHYFGGEPLNPKINKDVEYNLLELSNVNIGMERKIHLKNISSDNTDKWVCDIRPQDKVISELYDYTKEYIKEESFKIIGISKNHNSWETVCQKIYNWEKNSKDLWYKNSNELYRSICKYRNNGSLEVDLNDKDIFEFVCERIKEQIKSSLSNNIINIRGEYCSGKSSFLGLFYIYLLNQYSVGKINFIPAYFNLEKEELITKITNSNTYFEAVVHTFRNFSQKIQKTAQKEHQIICYIIDGLDEQDCWSYSTEDSIGRALLNVISENNTSRYIMSFSQHRLPYFKNTMPARKYGDSSDIMYFNPIDILENSNENPRLLSFVNTFISIQNNSNVILDSLNKTVSIPDKINDEYINNMCETIRNFRRLTITPGFMYDNLEYILEQVQTVPKTKNNYVSEIYDYYIDKQNEICLKKLGYNFVNYAPAMAFLFSFRGYTYEKFKNIRSDSSINSKHVFESINENDDKIYSTFLFIKKYKDARDYLIALHYNREIRYYTEHPFEEIDPDSILNEFISRNIAVLIRKQWKDTNKFIIACEILIKRKDLPACMQSMLIYCLAHLHMYNPIRDKLKMQLNNYGYNFLRNNNCNENWEINNTDKNSSEQLDYFINLSLYHSIKVFELIGTDNSIQLVYELLSKKNFREYNRLFQMLYYEDLSIKGEETKRVLNPTQDIIYKGFDFHNCFYYLFAKLSSPYIYPLREYDMFTLWDLIQSRLSKQFLDDSKSDVDPETFFYRRKFFQKATMVLTEAEKIFDNYLNDADNVNKSHSVISYFKNVKKAINDIINENSKKFNYKFVKNTLEELEKETSKDILSE